MTSYMIYFIYIYPQTLLNVIYNKKTQNVKVSSKLLTELPAFLSGTFITAITKSTTVIMS